MKSSTGFLGRALWSLAFTLESVNTVVHWDRSLELPEKLGMPATFAPYLLGTVVVFGFLGSIFVVANFVRLGAAIHALSLCLCTLHTHADLSATYGTAQQWKHIMHLLKDLSLLAALIMFVNYENRIIAQKEKYTKTL